MQGLPPVTSQNRQYEFIALYTTKGQKPSEVIRIRIWWEISDTHFRKGTDYVSNAIEECHTLIMNRLVQESPPSTGIHMWAKGWCDFISALQTPLPKAAIEVTREDGMGALVYPDWR